MSQEEITDYIIYLNIIRKCLSKFINDGNRYRIEEALTFIDSWLTDLNNNKQELPEVTIDQFFESIKED